MTLLRRLRPALWLLGLAFLAHGGRLSADSDTTKYNFVRVGDPAPAVECKDDQGGVWKSSQHYGKKYVVLFFYLGDFMPKDVRQACVYQENLTALAAQGAEVVGVSGDAAANHPRFKDAYHLSYTLLSDSDGAVGTVFGVPMSGGGEFHIKDAKGADVILPRGATCGRWTWILGKDGIVLYKNEAAEPEKDARQVLKFLTDLNAQQQQQP